MIRVLVIDDEQAFLMGIKDFLETSEISVDTAGTFHEAITLLNRHPYDAAIVDVRLTGILSTEGLDILRLIKQNYSHMKVIIITGYGNADLKHRAYKFGADSYFEKPVSADILLKELKNEG
jgi:DNA-binding response OmpR family regulator